MITQVTCSEQLSTLPEKGLEAQKIRALHLAYGTGYDFCRFYRQENSFLSLLDGNAVLCDDSSTDYEEWSRFILMCGCRELFCSETAAVSLMKTYDFRCNIVYLMRFEGIAHSEHTVREPSLADVYNIIREGFDIEFEPWYLDMSHRVRHGITQCRTLEGKAALVIQHDLNGEALLSQVAALRAHRGEGYASRLVHAVSTELAPSEVYIVCEDRLVGFYEKCGYSVCGKRCILYP